MAKNIVNLKIDGTSYSARPYGTCTTAAGTAAKAVTCADFSLTTGATILVKFTYANSVASPTLNVNNTGAKPIYYRGAALGSSLYYWGANDTVEFYYNGTQWDLMDVGNTNSTYANYSFGNGYATCATAEATTAKVATYQYYSLATGGIVAVKFTYAVPANATLNINSKGAKSIYHNNAAITAGVIGAGDIATFVYDGTNYVLLAVDSIMTATEKTKLAGIATGANKYTLPNATSSTLGGVKIGSNISVSSGTISLTKSNVTNALGYTPPTTNTTYSAATQSAAGLMSAADKKKLDGITEGANKYTLPNATSSTLGGVKIGSNISVASDGTISLTKANVALALGYTPPTTSFDSRYSQFVDVVNSLNNSSANPIIPTEAFFNYAEWVDSPEDNLAYLDFYNENAKTLYYDGGGWRQSSAATALYIPYASSSESGLMSAADKTKLNGIATGANKYTLPNATSQTLGGVKIGSNISVSSGTISLTKSNVTTALGYTPPTTNTTYGVATTSADGLLSKSIYSRMMNDSYGIIDNFQDNPISITQTVGNVGVHFNLSADIKKLGDGTIKDDQTLSSGTTTIPAATTTVAGVMSAADKQRLDQPFTGLVDGKGETVTMTSSPIDPIVPINEYLNLSLRALPGISVAFATYNSNALVASPHLYKQAQRCAIVLDKSQLSTIDYQTITWRTSAISGYGTPWSEQDEYSLIYIPRGYQSITFKHTSDYYNISAVGVHPTKYGGGYIFSGEWQYANESRTITLNNSDLYVILQAKKVDNSDIDPKLDILSELGLSITLNRTDNNICRGFVLNDGTQVYPVFKSAQNNDFNRICYYTNLSGNAAKPKLGDILDCLAVYCHSLPYGYYKIIVQPPNNAREKYGVFDVLVSQDQSYSECKYLDVTAMINLNSVSDMSDLPFGHIWGQINTEPDMAGAYSFQSMYSNEWVYER